MAIRWSFTRCRHIRSAWLTCGENILTLRWTLVYNTFVMAKKEPQHSCTDVLTHTYVYIHTHSRVQSQCLPQFSWSKGATKDSIAIYAVRCMQASIQTHSKLHKGRVSFRVGAADYTQNGTVFIKGEYWVMVWMFLLNCETVKSALMSVLLSFTAVNKSYEFYSFPWLSNDKEESRAEVFKINPRVPLGLLEGFRGEKKPM